MINREPIIVCDPTLLHDFSEFTNNFIPTKERYILTYILGSDIEGGNENAILEIKKKTGIKNVYTIVLSENAPKFIHWATKVLYEVDPIEWLRLFYNSSFIYTDSFHGVMFAIKFQKQFITYYTEQNRASRFIDLQERFGLKNIVTSIIELQDSFTNGYEKMPYIENIKNNIEDSKLFLKTSLSIS